MGFGGCLGPLPGKEEGKVGCLVVCEKREIPI